jgi:redox-sensitive bicupin YhaK (pirin superfamily)
LVTLASGFDNDNDALPIRSRARVLGATLKVGETVEYALGERRHGYLVPASGAVEVNGLRIDARDGAAIKDVAVVKIRAIEDSELVMVDAP